MKSWIAVIALIVTAAHAQQPAAPQPAAPQRTTEQQARSYIMSAFMTGSAPMIIGSDVIVAPELRERLGLPADADTRKVYDALATQTVGRPLTVRRPSADEVAKVSLQQDPGRPLFSIDTGEATFLVQYDLERDSITHVAQLAAPEAAKQAETPAPAPVQPAPVATPVPEHAAPSMSTEPAQAAQPEPAPVAPPAPAQAVAPAAPAAAAAAAPVYGSAEPRIPRSDAKGAPVAKPAAVATRVAAPPPPPLPKPNGPCAIKPVMSDQDLVNCGATPRYQ